MKKIEQEGQQKTTQVCVSHVGFNCPKLTSSMHVFGPRTSAHVIWHMYFLYGFPIDKPTYISESTVVLSM